MLAEGSLESGSRVAVVDDALVGACLLVGHGHATVAVDPASPCAGAVFLSLIDWLSEHGGVQFDSASQDTERLERLAFRSFVPCRSSFDLERPADVSDLPVPVWPSGIALAPFRLGVDDEERHAMVYEFWVHCSRP